MFHIINAWFTQNNMEKGMVAAIFNYIDLLHNYYNNQLWYDIALMLFST